jgi:tetratricopeptide (TPR) repeat protein
LPDWTPRVIIIIALVGFPIAIILSWIFDITPEGLSKTESIEELKEQETPPSPVKRRLKVSDVIIGVLVIVVGILAYPRFIGTPRLNAMTVPVTVVNEFGERETRRVYTEDYLTKLALFPFNNEVNDSSIEWLWAGIPEAVREDMHQFSNILIEWDDATHLNKQIAFAKERNFPFFLTGSFRLDDTIYEITTRLYQASNSSVRYERIYRGADFFSLVDSICIQVRQDLGIFDFILNITPDLPIVDLMTDNLDAYENYIRSRFFTYFGYDLYTGLVRAIEIDSTFAYAQYTLAGHCYHYQGSYESAVRNINQAMRQRDRMSEISDIKTRIQYYLIIRDIEKVVDLSEFVYELRSWDLSFLNYLYFTYSKINQIDRAEKVAIRMNELAPSHPSYQIMLAQIYMLSGKPKKSLEVLNSLLAENPENVEALLLKGEAFLHIKDLEAAEATYRKAILIKPEYEHHWSELLDHIDYIRSQADNREFLKFFANSCECEDSEFSSRRYIIQNQLYQKATNQSGGFVYPVSDTVLMAAFTFGPQLSFFKVTFYQNSKRKAVRLLAEQWIGSDCHSWWSWIEDSFILSAKDHLAEKRTREALDAFRKAYDQNPDHYYLANYIQHLEFITNPGYESSKSVFDGYVGSYGDLKFQVERHRLYHTNRQGLIFELLPLSENKFMVPSIYELQIQIVMENGLVSGMKYLYWDGREEYFQRKTSEIRLN